VKKTTEEAFRRCFYGPPVSSGPMTKSQGIAQLLVDPTYHVDMDGTVYTCVSRQGHVDGRWRIKPVCVDKCGYHRIRYYRTNIFVHRLVFAKFNGTLESDMQVNHIDGNPGNNHAENLNQMYPSENMLHSNRVLHRVVNYGNSKISEDQAIDMRNMYAKGSSYAELMKHFKVSKTTVSYVINLKIWRPKDG
jgi:hypothetical protein